MAVSNAVGSSTNSAVAVLRLDQFETVNLKSIGIINVSCASSCCAWKNYDQDDYVDLCVFEAAADLEKWMKLGVRTNLTGTVEFTDTFAAKYLHRFYRGVAP